MPHKKNTLTIEHFHDDEDAEFSIHSKKGILSILGEISKNRTSVALYYDEAHNFLLTTLLYVSEEGLWLDVSPFPPENKRVLLSDKITFVSMHQQVKVQFVTYGILEASFEGGDAFYMELPDNLLRIQRRDFFRLNVPTKDALKCIVTTRPFDPEKPDDAEVIRKVPVVDISGGGFSLLCGEKEDELLPGKTFSDCRIALPDIGTVIVDIEVKNHIRVTSPQGLASTRVGCRFINLSNQMNFLLQQYISLLQSESLAKGV